MSPTYPVQILNTTPEVLESLVGKRVMINHPSLHIEAELIKSKIYSSRFGAFVASKSDIIGVWFNPEQVESIDLTQPLPRIYLCNLQ